MRQSLGTAVLFGMLGVTCFGLLFTPAFYTFVRKLGRKDQEVASGYSTSREASGGVQFAPLRSSARQYGRSDVRDPA
jgi:hypothetical protein